MICEYVTIAVDRCILLQLCWKEGVCLLCGWGGEEEAWIPHVRQRQMGFPWLAFCSKSSAFCNSYSTPLVCHFQILCETHLFSWQQNSNDENMHSGVEFYCSLSMLFLCVLLYFVQACFCEGGSREKRPFESCCVLPKAPELKITRGGTSVNFKRAQYWLLSWHTPGVVWVLLFSVALV